MPPPPNPYSYHRPCLLRLRGMGGAPWHAGGLEGLWHKGAPPPPDCLQCDKGLTVSVITFCLIDSGGGTVACNRENFTAGGSKQFAHRLSVGSKTHYHYSLWRSQSPPWGGGKSFTPPTKLTDSFGQPRFCYSDGHCGHFLIEFLNKGRSKVRGPLRGEHIPDSVSV